MEKRGEHLLREKTKKLSVLEGSFFGVHDGLGMRYIAPFALAIGKNNQYVTTFIAIIQSFPLLVGNLSQLLTNNVMQKYRRKYLLSLFVILQSVSWIGVLFSGLLFFKFGLSSTTALIFLTISYTLLVSFGSFVSPVWASLMKDIVVDKRGNYFSRRNLISGFVALSFSLLAGLLLDSVSDDKIFLGFSILFLFAFIFRCTSGILFLFHYDPKFKPNNSSYFSFFDFVKKYRTSNFAKFSFFISFFILSVSIASPFFVVYMLENLGFSYLKWTIITVTGSLSSLFFMPFWGNFVDTHGSIKTLKFTGLLVSIIPLVWMLTYYMNPSGSVIFIYLIILELFAGCMWAGFNLSYSNFIYDAVTNEKTHLCSAYFNLLYAIGVFVGAIVGSMVISFDVKLLFVNSLFFVFFLSGLFRVVTYFLIIPRVNEVRDVQTISVEKTFEKLVKYHVKPFADIFHLKIIRPRPSGI